MDPILYVFGVVAASAAGQGGLEWWRGRSLDAALYLLLGVVAATPFTVCLPDGVIVAGLLVLVAVVGWLLWPHPDYDHDQVDATGDDGVGRDTAGDRPPDGGRRGRGGRGGRS